MKIAAILNRQSIAILAVGLAGLSGGQGWAQGALNEFNITGVSASFQSDQQLEAIFQKIPGLVSGKLERDPGSGQSTGVLILRVQAGYEVKVRDLVCERLERSGIRTSSLRMMPRSNPGKTVGGGSRSASF